MNRKKFKKEAEIKRNEEIKILEELVNLGYKHLKVTGRDLTFIKQRLRKLKKFKSNKNSTTPKTLKLTTNIRESIIPLNNKIKIKENLKKDEILSKAAS